MFALALLMLSSSALALDRIPTTEAEWELVYNGFGNVSFCGAEGITMQSAPVRDGSAHSVLLLAERTRKAPLSDFELRAEFMLERQLRTQGPNPWEAFWVFFNYRPVGAHKETNYLLLKTNGVELGRAFDEKGQRFLKTESRPALALGRWYRLRIRRVGNGLRAEVDGKLALEYSGSLKEPDRLLDAPGRIGLYTEDARVRVRSIQFGPPRSR